MDQRIKDKIVENGVKNLKKFGYPSINKENILTDMIYKQFFERMLKDNLDHGFDDEINSILEDMKK